MKTTARGAALLLAMVLLSSCDSDDAPASATKTAAHTATATLTATARPSPTPTAAIDVSGDPIVLNGAASRVEIARDPYRLRFSSGSHVLAEERGRGPFYERAGQRYELTRVTGDSALADGVELQVETSEGATARVVVTRLSDRSVRVTVEPPDPATLSAVGDRFASPADERIYGLSERLRDSRPISPPAVEIPEEDIAPLEVGSLDRRGETVEMFVRPTIALYAPFFHSSRGYGLWVEGTAAGAFDLAAADPGLVSFRFETGDSDASRRLVFDLISGPEHGRILDEYTALSGRPFVPPAWAFEHWRWQDLLPIGETALLDGTEVNALVAEDLAMYEAHDIPAGVYLFDRPVLAGNFGFARFAWDEERLPHVEEMLAALRRRGFRLLTWSAAWTCGSGSGDLGEEAKRLGYLAPGSTGTPLCADINGASFILDVTRAEARAWFADKLGAFVSRYGLDGIKLDRGEEHIPSLASDVWGDSRNGREVRNDYPNLQAAMHHAALAAVRPDEDFVLISRAGYAGTQRSAIAWGGDIAGSTGFGAGAGTDLGLRSAIIAQLRAAFLGFPIWGSDTGGYYQFKNREVFARWIEFSTFSGIMEIGGKGKHAPWDMPTEPHVDSEMIDIYARYTRLRHALVPYIAATAEEARSGLPLARPLVFAYRDDPAVADLWDEYLFGPDLLVAPVWRVGERARQVYFPAGEWRSYWNESERYTGPTTATISAPLDVIPVFVRQGASAPR